MAVGHDSERPLSIDRAAVPRRVPARCWFRLMSSGALVRLMAEFSSRLDFDLDSL